MQSQRELSVLSLGWALGEAFGTAESKGAESASKIREKKGRMTRQPAIPVD